MYYRITDWLAWSWHKIQLKMYMRRHGYSSLDPGKEAWRLAKLQFYRCRATERNGVAQGFIYIGLPTVQETTAVIQSRRIELDL